MGAPEEGRGGLVEAGAALAVLSSPSQGSSRALLVAALTMPTAPRLHTPQYRLAWEPCSVGTRRGFCAKNTDGLFVELPFCSIAVPACLETEGSCVGTGRSSWSCGCCWGCGAVGKACGGEHLAVGAFCGESGDAAGAASSSSALISQNCLETCSASRSAE